MSDELSRVVAELTELEAKATAAPWSRTSSWDIDCEECGSATDLVCCKVKDGGDYATAYIQVCGMESFAAPNSALIVAMRNALPTLLAAARRVGELERERDAAREALRPFAAAISDADDAKPDGYMIARGLLMLHFRAARAAIAGE